MPINSAFRNDAQQALLRKQHPELAAPVGKSRHNEDGRNYAFDINTAYVDFLENKGLLDKYGFKRGWEGWHIDGGGGSKPENVQVGDDTRQKSKLDFSKIAGIQTGDSMRLLGGLDNIAKSSKDSAGSIGGNIIDLSQRIASSMGGNSSVSGGDGGGGGDKSQYSQYLDALINPSGANAIG